jgi:hypothetical protein
VPKRVIFDMTIYNENGFANRKAYLIDLADSYGLDHSIVFALADMLGSTGINTMKQNKFNTLSECFRIGKYLAYVGW